MTSKSGDTSKPKIRVNYRSDDIGQSNNSIGNERLVTDDSVLSNG